VLKKSCKNFYCVASEAPTFEKGRKEIEEGGCQVKKCALCDFTSESRDKFLSHIRIHRPIIKRRDMAEVPTSLEAVDIALTSTGLKGDGREQEAALNFNEVTESECLQCKECGMCFASEPSWKKHLFLLHRIKRPQPDDYCADLVPTLQQQVTQQPLLEAETATESMEATTMPPPTLNVTPVAKPPEETYKIKKKTFFKELTHLCNVCNRRFSGQLKLRRHFRSQHGMALVMQQ